MNFQSLIREGIFGHDQFRCAILVCTEISIFCKYIPIINWWHHSYFLSSKLKIKTKNWQFNVITVVMMIHLRNSTKKAVWFYHTGKITPQKSLSLWNFLSFDQKCVGFWWGIISQHSWGLLFENNPLWDF